jgi:hypothetical protein
LSLLISDPFSIEYYHKSLYLKEVQSMAMSFSSRGEKAGGSDFVVKFICASIASHCGSKGSGTVHTAKQSKSSYLKTV